MFALIHFPATTGEESNPIQKNSEGSSYGTTYLRLRQEQRRSRRILRAERLSFEWKLATSAKTAPKVFFLLTLMETND